MILCLIPRVCQLQASIGTSYHQRHSQCHTKWQDKTTSRVFLRMVGELLISSYTFNYINVISDSLTCHNTILSMWYLRVAEKSIMMGNLINFSSENSQHKAQPKPERLHCRRLSHCGCSSSSSIYITVINNGIYRE